MILDQKDLELIERIVYKNNDDVAVSICRSFERLEEKTDAMEARLHSRISEIEDRVVSERQDIDESLIKIDDKLAEIADDHKSLREVVTA